MAFTVLGIGLQAVMAMTSEALKIFNDIPALIGYTSLALLLITIPIIRNCALWLSKISYEYFHVHILVFTPIIRISAGKSLVLQASAGVIAIGTAILIALFYHKLINAKSIIYNAGKL
jgi:peptidoglycan/LPS O-acetylase OafA/YrhL